jgi:BT_3987-like, N-terminal domain
MKYKYIFLQFFMMLLLSSCLKDTPAVDFSTVGTIIEILPPDGGGLENFDAAALEFDPADISDDADIDLNIASPKPLTKSLIITVAVDDGLRTSYNANNGTAYEAMPDSVYSFPVKTGTIDAGQRLDTIRVTFYPSKIDQTKNYMLPVSIKDAQGENISGNFGSIYFHIDAQ